MNPFDSTIVVFLVAFFISYAYHGLGITLGYHRLLSHRALKVPKWFEYFIVSGGYLALEGSPIFWVATHRLHHRYSDHKGDPHSPLDGLWHAFVSWMWKPTVTISAEQSRLLVPDLYRDHLYTFLHCRHSGWDGALCLVATIALRVSLFFLFGPIVVVANVLAAMVAFTGPLLVNSLGHVKAYGYQSYECGDNSRNNWLVASLSLGEGWHNNHHAFPQSARHGLKSIEIDPTWICIQLLKLVGIASNIRLPKKNRPYTAEDAANTPVPETEQIPETAKEAAVR